MSIKVTFTHSLSDYSFMIYLKIIYFNNFDALGFKPNAYLVHIIFVGCKSSYELSRSFSQNIFDTFTYTVL